MEDGEALLRDKRVLEGIILGPSCDQETRVSYFGLLSRINRQFTGVLDFRWDAVPYPLYFRSGSTDLRNFAQIFLNREYGFPIPFKPRRILDLGAYVGFAAIFLAQRFPDAEIVCVEPSAENFRLLMLNTSAYSNIRQINAAVWSEAGRLRLDRHTPGDWGMHVVKSSTEGQEVAALSLSDILGHAHWDKADFLKCDIEGTEREVFSEARASIAGSVNCCAIEIHERAAPGSAAAVAACFNSADFDPSRSGEFHVYMRRVIDDKSTHIPVVHVLRLATGPRAITLGNVPEQPWGYYTFDGMSCQLNAPSQGSPPAELTTTINFSGQSVFDCDVTVENPLGHGVTFGLAVYDDSDGSKVADTKIDVAAGQKVQWTCPIGAQQGARRVVLSTIMAAGTPTNHQVRSYWMDPKFRGESGG